MEQNFSEAVGKSRGEVIRDIGEFLSTPFLINRQKQLDLCRMLPDLNMQEQLAFALLSEAREQQWAKDETEHFFRAACMPSMGEDAVARMLAVFDAPESGIYAGFEARYGNRFRLMDDSYWATVLALGLDAGEIDRSIAYLRLFTVTLMEVAYMEGRNPPTTYTWGYYESFVGMLDALVAPPDPAPVKVRVKAIGGTAGKRNGNAYLLSLGVDIENPDPVHTAKKVELNIALKDKDGKTITVIRDQLCAIPPKSMFHYGVTRRIAGPAAARFAATVKAEKYEKTGEAPPHAALTQARYGHEENETRLEGTLTPSAPRPYSALCLYYQYRSEQNKIVGGGSEWFYPNKEQEDAPLALSATLPLEIKTAARVVVSGDFDLL